jgi:hypothetical protein
MKIIVLDVFGIHACDVEVSPSDTIWTLKCKLHREALKRPSERAEGGAIIPPPDDQKLVLHPNYEALSQCEKTLELYGLHEGSKVRCDPKWSEFPQEMNFRKCVDVFRKVERNELTLSFQWKVTSGMSVCAYHACCHMHEVTVLDLQYGELGDEGAIRIAEGLEKNTSLKKLDLFSEFAPPHSFFIHCWISHSFIS